MFTRRLMNTNVNKGDVYTIKVYGKISDRGWGEVYDEFPAKTPYGTICNLGDTFVVEDKITMDEAFKLYVENLESPDQNVSMWAYILKNGKPYAIGSYYPHFETLENAYFTYSGETAPPDEFQYDVILESAFSGYLGYLGEMVVFSASRLESHYPINIDDFNINEYSQA